MNILGNLGNQMEKAAYDLPATRPMNYKPRTFREQIQDQIAHHTAKIADLQAVLDSLTPEVEKFVEAVQKIG